MPELPEAFIVATSFRVPGLGVITFPTTPPPAWLADYALHTALAIVVHTTGQPPQSITGSVEEVLYDDKIPRRGLLLDFNPIGELHPGSYLQASDESTQPLEAASQ